MPRCALPLLSGLLVLAAPTWARATEPAEAWAPSGTILRASAAGISLPQTVAGLSLSKSGEVSHGGKGVDNYAQYLSDDGAIQATLYIYMPSYADASVAAYMTDKAILERFGATTERSFYGAASAGGRPGTAIRALYDDAANGALTTAAAFVRTGRWLVKLRVTGPTERRRDVLAGLDGMLNGLRFDQPQSIHVVSAERFANCPARQDASAAPGRQARGEAAFCIQDRVQAADGSYDVLRQTGVANGSVIVPIDDAGTVMAFDPAATGRGYQLSIHSIGQTKLFGTYENLPGPSQIAEILDGKDSQAALAKATADYAATGEVTMRPSGPTAR